MTHREIIKEYLSKINLEDKKVIDWGSGSKPAMRYIKHDERCIFTTIDNAPGIPRDRQGDHHENLDISQPIVNYFRKQFDIAFCLEVLEHVEDPQQLIANISDSLKDDGILYLSAPFKYKIHGESDYWRFTRDGIKLLLEHNGFLVFDIQETVDELGYIVEAHK